MGWGRWTATAATALAALAATGTAACGDPATIPDESVPTSVATTDDTAEDDAVIGVSSASGTAATTAATSVSTSAATSATATSGPTVTTPPTEPPPASVTTAPAAAVTVETADAIFGPILSDGAGRTLYGRTADAAGSPTCVGTCEVLWPPVLVGAGLEAGDGVDPGLLSIVPRPGSDPQLVIAGQPAYYFAEDLRPGAVSGHGTDGEWFVFLVDGTMLRPRA